MSRDFRPDLEAVFDHYGARIIQSSGEWMKACCPLLAHEDMSPSASVNIDAGKWSCFSCGNGGDAFDIIEQNEEDVVGFAEARRFAEANFEGGVGAVRTERDRAGGLPHRSRNRGERGSWSPPWKSV